jgi:hypothetical protein
MSHPPNEPTPPEALPKYIAEGLPKQNINTLEAVIEYAEALIEYQSHPPASEELPDTAEPIPDADSSGDGTVVKEWVKCGDESCQCTSGNQVDMHGPYKYRYYRSDGSLTSEYLGKA